MLAAAAWAAFDAALHVIVQQVEPLRIAGNLATMLGAALAVGAVALGADRLAAVISALAGGLVLGLNTAWAINGNGLPVPDERSSSASPALMLWAAFRFLVTSRDASAAAAIGGTAGSVGRRWPRSSCSRSRPSARCLRRSSARRSTNSTPTSSRLRTTGATTVQILSAGFGFDNTVGTPR